MAAMIFEKDWEEEEVMASFYSAFSFLPQTVKLEIMLPCGNSLVKPHISGGNMDGQIIHQIFCRKTIYLQPSKQLLEESDTCTVEKETLDLPDLHPPKKRQDTCSKEQKTMDLPDLHPPKKRQDTCTNDCNICIFQMSDEFLFRGAMDEDEALETAIQESVDEYTITSKSEERESAYGRYEQVQGRTPEEVRGIVSAWADNKISGVDRRLIVSRNTVFKSSLMYFKRDAFVKKASLLKVSFTSDEGSVEDAADAGGPRRAYFRLLWQSVIESSGLVTD
ncbi:uncharacterized protein LOC143049473 [Mytilus galloprovincialis]|uniref:uncharacterized protein LOC143049473 n=1 Tax=Mytilus galloprovincialis TaxID=29158 RepID=UPI003F7BC348